MKLRSTGIAALFIVAGLQLSAGTARAAEPTTSDCLTAHGASLRLGDEHKLRADRAQLLTCAQASCPAEIRRACLRRVGDVNAALPSILFEVKDGSGNDLSAVKVTMDGELLAERLDGSALVIDPGDHRFVFETAGQPPLEKRFVIRESQKDRREPITLGPVASPAPAMPAPVAQPPATSPAAAPAPSIASMVTMAPTPALPEPLKDTSPSDTGKAQRTLGYVVGGVGVVGLAVGTVFGL